MYENFIVELKEERDRCKEALDRAQQELNKALLATSPVKRGDIVQDEDQNIFRVLSVSVKTIYSEDGTLQDRLMFEFQRQKVTESQTYWQKMTLNSADLASRVLSGKAKIVRHARV